MNTIIETHNLTKRYKDFTAVNKINLHIQKGRIYGFLGPNGAGKSTTMKMFLGLTAPTSGSFSVNGKTYPKDRREILRETGSFIESPAYYGNLTGEENLQKQCQRGSGINRTLRTPQTPGIQIFSGHETASGTCGSADGTSSCADSG